MLRRNFLYASLLAFSLTVVSCTQGTSDNQTAGSSNTDKFASDSGSELIMGLIPAENNEEMVEKFEPMRAYMEEKLNRPIKVFTATDYAGVIEAMRQDKVDIAWFGPLSYVLAEQEAGAEAFATGVREKTGKSTYKSILVVPGDSYVKSIQDLKGKNVAFVDPASTSGGLVPSYLVLKATGQKPKDFFAKLTYAGSHDAAGMAVKNKTVDAAGTNDITYNKMLNKGLISQQSNRILLESDPIPGSPLAYRQELDEQTKNKIREIVLNAHEDIEVTGYGELLNYESATPKDYQIVRDMINTLEIAREEILK
ncbi:MAG: phosphonate ABC transporter substrate-binding protein [Symploca sp. SIO2B6]|nr:phosphonate ABC transporter substrate-binding protein [Symploca sp. SIO2B6]